MKVTQAGLVAVGCTLTALLQATHGRPLVASVLVFWAAYRYLMAAPSYDGQGPARGGPQCATTPPAPPPSHPHLERIGARSASESSSSDTSSPGPP